MEINEELDTRKTQLELLEKQAGVREEQSEIREEQSGVREHKIEGREELLNQRNVVVDHQHHVLHGYMRLILWVAVVLFVITILSLIRSFQLGNSVDTLDTHTDDLLIETNLSRAACDENSLP